MSAVQPAVQPGGRTARPFQGITTTFSLFAKKSEHALKPQDNGHTKKYFLAIVFGGTCLTFAISNHSVPLYCIGAFIGVCLFFCYTKKSVLSTKKPILPQ